MEKYDEDIYDNPFFIALTTQFSDLYEEATHRRWMLGIPKYSIIGKEDVVKDDILHHVIIPVSEETDLYKSWAETKLKISNGIITVLDSSQGKKVKILFEEVFYNNNNDSFRVLCLNNYLNKDVSESMKDFPSREPLTKRPGNFEECQYLLFRHSGGRKLEEQLTKLLESFMASYSRLKYATFRNVLDAVSAQYTKAIQTVLKNADVRRFANHSQVDLDNLKLAVEMYLMHALHRPMFQTVTSCLSSQDAHINKIIRNSVDTIKPSDLGIKKEFTKNLLAAKKELSHINRYSTPIGRRSCMKRCMTILSKPGSEEQGSESDLIMTTDDILPLLILLVIRSEIPNWYANLMYMKHFHLSMCTDDSAILFHLTTLEAALEHIKTGKLKEDAAKLRSPKKESLGPVPSSTAVGRQRSGGMSVIEKFFQYVQYGDEAAVKLMLRKPTGDTESPANLCHPLCSCDKCSKVTNQVKSDVDLVTAYSRDERGYTALHIAALYGQAHLIDVLIKHGAVVNASDYLGFTPLHLACQKGYQNILLLLVHFHADCRLTDAEGNTPLHLCVDKGHEDCVKAMVFLDVVSTKININAQNVRGDTPLHLAAKWGYENIVSVLLESDALPSIRNRKKQLPYNVAQSTKVQEILKQALSMPRIETKKQRSDTLKGYNVVTSNKHAEETKNLSTSPTSPITPEVTPLDHNEAKQLNLLFKAITDGDLPLIKFHMGWDDLKLKTESSSPSVSMTTNLCHPLCDCPKCQPLQSQQQSSEPEKRKGLDINIQDRYGHTPLHRAVIFDNLPLVQMFVEHGADVDAKTNKGMTPLHYACCLLKDKVASYLISRGTKLNVKDSGEYTPLHMCAAKGIVATIRELVQKGANINQPGPLSNTPLHEAAAYDQLDAVEALVQLGADTSLLNSNEEAAIDLTQTEEIRQILLKCGAKQKHLEGSIDGIYHHIIDDLDSSSPGKSSFYKGNASDSIHDLFASFEYKDLEAMSQINDSIRSLGWKSTLKRSKTFDRSQPNTTRLRHWHSIESFDKCTLKHVQLFDKSDPIYLFKVSVSDLSPGFYSEDSLPEEDGEEGVKDEGGLEEHCNDYVFVTTEEVLSHSNDKFPYVKKAQDALCDSTSVNQALQKCDRSSSIVSPDTDPDFDIKSSAEDCERNDNDRCLESHDCDPASGEVCGESSCEQQGEDNSSEQSSKEDVASVHGGNKTESKSSLDLSSAVHVDKSADKVTGENTGKNTKENTDTITDENSDKGSIKHLDKNTTEHIDKNTDEHLDKNTNEHIDKSTNEHLDKNTDEHIDKSTDEHLDKNTNKNTNDKTDDLKTPKDIQVSEDCVCDADAGCTNLEVNDIGNKRVDSGTFFDDA